MNVRQTAGVSAAVLAVLLAASGCTQLGVGSGDAGLRTSTVVYQVTGKGSADVRYAATATSKLTTDRGVELPFSVGVQTVDHSQTVYQVSASHSSGGPLSCSITVNGDTVVRQTAAANKPVTCEFIK